jgi:hypothetical protein
MANKQEKPISRWGCAKAIYFSGIVVILLAALMDGCDNPKKSGSPYSAVLCWIYILAVICVLLNAKFKKGFFE